MTRLMYDSVTAADIPAGAEMVAGYINGPYAWSDADWARFAGKAQVRINVNGDHGAGDCLDVERYDASPADAPGWIRAREAAGVADVSVYCDLSTLPAVEKECAGLSYYRWVAHYTGHAHTEPGTAACQYASPEFGSGGHYDLSLVSNDNWHPEDWTTAIMEQLKTLKMGDTGFPVDNLNALLGGSWSRLGDSPVPVTQSFNADTERQLKLVQSRHGLVVDGICGPKTWHLLLLAD